MIKLPPAFEFSQSSLQDYVECPRRFEYRYLMQQQWPAPPAEPLSEVERAGDLGSRFHLLMQRYYLDLPVEGAALDSTLGAWWDAFIANPPPLSEAEHRPEVYTSVVLNGQRLSATFDLLSDSGDLVTIVDWKTAHKRPNRATLDRRLQTIVYPFVLVEAAARLLGRTIHPEQVRLIYWFANAPEQTEIFPYSARRYQEDRDRLAAIIEEILTSESFPLTEALNRCSLCQYRSLDDRGKTAGSLDEADADELSDVQLIDESESPIDSTSEPYEFWL